MTQISDCQQKYLLLLTCLACQWLFSDGNNFDKKGMAKVELQRLVLQRLDSKIKDCFIFQNLHRKFCCQKISVPQGTTNRYQFNSKKPVPSSQF